MGVSAFIELDSFGGFRLRRGATRMATQRGYTGRRSQKSKSNNSTEEVSSDRGDPRASHFSEQRVWEVEDAWDEARLRNDPDAAAEIIADDYIGGNSYGHKLRKRDILHNIRHYRNLLSEIQKLDRNVALHSDVALSTGEARFVFASRSHTIRFLRVFVLRNDKWLLLSSQSTLIRNLI